MVGAPSEELGIVVESDQGERFLSSSVALRVVPMPELTTVPGAPREVLGVALHEGEVILVLSAGQRTAELLVCRIDDSLVGLAGLQIRRVGVARESLEDFDLHAFVDLAANSRKNG